MSRVSIVRGRNAVQSIPRALNQLEGLDELFRGRYVAIKPNETWASREDTTACTQADSVRAVVRYIKRFNPSRIAVTGGAGAADTEEVFRLLGIDEVIRDEGVEFVDHNRAPFRKVDLDYGPQQSVMVSAKVLEYERLVSLAQLKVHDSAGVTLSMKNIAMSYPAADYYGHPRNARVHPHEFFSDLHAFIVGMCRVFPIDLGIVIGHPAMIGQGPTGGNAFEADLVLASCDFVAVDFVGALLLERGKVGHIRDAADQGLGKGSLEEIEIKGLDLEEARRHFSRLANVAARKAA